VKGARYREFAEARSQDCWASIANILMFEGDWPDGSDAELARQAIFSLLSLIEEARDTVSALEEFEKRQRESE